MTEALSHRAAYEDRRQSLLFSIPSLFFWSVASQAFRRCDSEQSESGGEAGPRRHGQGQSVTSRRSVTSGGASRVARGNQDINGDAGQILQVAGELVGPATA